MKSTSSLNWLKRQDKDIFVKQAKKDGYRARSAYKLIEINDKYHFLNQAEVVIDLGCAPGSWLQVVSAFPRVKKIVGIDLLPVTPISSDKVHIIQGDFTDSFVLKELYDIINPFKVSSILCDGAVNTTGHKVTDHLSTQNLVDTAFDVAKNLLAPKGSLLVKIFDGSETQRFIESMRHSFTKVINIKPDASRKESVERYVLGLDFKA